jgi:putative ABC transport system ATP-binding protein
MALISVNNIDYYFTDGAEQRYILRDVSCAFEPATFYTILGGSGSGKTTFLSLLAALDEPKAGRIELAGKTISEWGEMNYRSNKIGIVFQGYNLIPYLTAVENILTAMSITSNQLPADKKGVALGLLDYLGIDSVKAHRRVTNLSGGEQQRVAIARALSTNVDVILADEPTGNLDEQTAEDIVKVFSALAHEHGKTVIMVTHSADIAAVSDVVLRLSKGNLTS